MALPDPGAAVAIPRHRFTVDDFARLGEVGIFTEGDRVELIDGEIRDMTPIGQPHAWIVNRLNWRLVTCLAGRAYISVQNPLRLDRYTEPQPDLVVARGGEDDTPIVTWRRATSCSSSRSRIPRTATTVSRRCRAMRVPAYPRRGSRTSPAVRSPCSRVPAPTATPTGGSSGLGRKSRPPRSPACRSRSTRSSARSVTADADCSPHCAVDLGIAIEERRQVPHGIL